MEWLLETDGPMHVLRRGYLFRPCHCRTCTLELTDMARIMDGLHPYRPMVCAGLPRLVSVKPVYQRRRHSTLTETVRNMARSVHPVQRMGRMGVGRTIQPHGLHRDPARDDVSDRALYRPVCAGCFLPQKATPVMRHNIYSGHGRHNPLCRTRGHLKNIRLQFTTRNHLVCGILPHIHHIQNQVGHHKQQECFLL